MINRGVAFGLFQGISVWLVGFVWILLAYEFWRQKKERGALFLILLGGGINIFMRVRDGGVVDNWTIGGLLYNNLADYLIVIGLIWYGYRYIVRRRRNRSN